MPIVVPGGRPDTGGAGKLSAKPNVLAKRATAAERQAPAGENVPRTTGPGAGDLPLGLSLSEGLGLSSLANSLRRFPNRDGNAAL